MIGFFIKYLCNLIDDFIISRSCRLCNNEITTFFFLCRDCISVHIIIGKTVCSCCSSIIEICSCEKKANITFVNFSYSVKKIFNGFSSKEDRLKIANDLLSIINLDHMNKSLLMHQDFDVSDIDGDVVLVDV